MHVYNVHVYICIPAPAMRLRAPVVGLGMYTHSDLYLHTATYTLCMYTSVCLYRCTPAPAMRLRAPVVGRSNSYESASRDRLAVSLSRTLTAKISRSNL